MEKTYKRICEMFSDEELHDIAADQNSILQYRLWAMDVLTDRETIKIEEEITIAKKTCNKRCEPLPFEMNFLVDEVRKSINTILRIYKKYHSLYVVAAIILIAILIF